MAVIINRKRTLFEILIMSMLALFIDGLVIGDVYIKHYEVKGSDFYTYLISLLVFVVLLFEKSCIAKKISQTTHEEKPNMIWFNSMTITTYLIAWSLTASNIVTIFWIFFVY